MKETTWRKELAAVVEETEDPIIATTLTDAEMDRVFYDGYGSSEGVPFTAWGEKYVYFPVVYDGAEWVGYAPRNPCDERTGHWGGE